MLNSTQSMQGMLEVPLRMLTWSEKLGITLIWAAKIS